MLSRLPNGPDLIDAYRFWVQLTERDVAPFLTWAPPGHFYSAIPSMSELEDQADRIWDFPDELPGLPFDRAAVLDEFRRLAPLARDADLPAGPRPGWRFRGDNTSYGMGDALVFVAMVRDRPPARYLEVGSGWSTALALDIRDRWLGGNLQVTCIEPYPDALRAVLRPDDRIDLIDRPVQLAPVETVERLQPGDILFIDCSHVVKTGSDAHYILTRLLPRVPVGVRVQIHDIFWPFEYPKEWVTEGRAWSENYLLHAFLLHNDSFRIVMFDDWLCRYNRLLVDAELPAFLANPGGAIWLERHR